MNMGMWRLHVRAMCVAGVLFSIGSAFAGDVEKATLGKSLDDLFDVPAWRNAHWGVQVMDLDTSEILYERMADKGFIPASNLKIYTTAAAIKTLGQDFSYETKIYANGPVTRNRVLRGDIVVVGSGDPSISGRYNADTPTTAILRAWAKAVRDAGIRRVEGAVIGDDDCFDDSPRAGSWQLDYFQEWYAAESSGLAINENCWDVTVFPGNKPGAPAKLKVELPGSYVTFKNEIVTTVPAGKTEDDPPIDISRPLDSNVVILKGFIPADVPQHKMWGSVHNGTLWTATLLAGELERQGVEVAKGAVDIDDLPDKEARLRRDRFRLLHTHVSPPMSQLIATVNKPSQNFYADQLLKTLGARVRGKGSFAEGDRAVHDLLTTAGIDASGLKMLDGSGLSRQNLVEPRMTVGLLAYMNWQAESKAFYDSLPIAGVDGTIRKRMRNTPAENNVHAKTGYIGRVRCLSGYATSSDNHRVAFCLMVNNYLVETKFANDVQDSATLLLVNYSKGMSLTGGGGDEPVTSTATPEITKTDYTIEQNPIRYRKEGEPGGPETP